MPLVRIKKSSLLVFEDNERLQVQRKLVIMVVSLQDCHQVLISRCLCPMYPLSHLIKANLSSQWDMVNVTVCNVQV